MTKKLFIILMLLVPLTTMCVLADGDDPTPLPIKPTNPGDIHDQLPKSPILIPEVYLNGNVLTFDEALEGTTVQLLDEDDIVVFSDFIEENQTSIVFPTTLSGYYKLLIVCDDITFYCEIQL